MRRIIVPGLFCFIAAFVLAAVAMPAATPPSGDPPLNLDARFRAVSAQIESGDGTDTGVYLPPIASRAAEIVGRVVDPTAPGPYRFYLAVVGADGKTTYFGSETDRAGRLHFRAPPNAAGLQLFRHFDARGVPDAGSRTELTSEPRHLPDTQMLTGPFPPGPLIIEANSVYKRDDPDAGILHLQTRFVDPLSATAVLDGQAGGADLLAASDRSVVAQFHHDATLGRHNFALAMPHALTNAFPCDLVSLVFDPLKPLRVGSMATVTVHVLGLPSTDAATIKFVVTGAAAIAGGAPSVTLPVSNQSAAIQIRGVRAGQLVVTSTLDAGLPQFSNERPTYPPLGFPTPVFPPQSFPTTVALERSPAPQQSPSLPSPSSSGARTSSSANPPHPATSAGVTPSAPPPKPSPEPSTTESPTPEPSPSPSPSPTPPCDYRIVDGWFEPTQGVWQDDTHFEDSPPRKLNPQLIRLGAPDSPPRYTAELPMVVNRHSVVIGVHHYYQPWPDIHVVDSRQRILMKIRTNCQKKVGVKMRFTLTQGDASSVIYTSKPLDPVELDPPRAKNYMDVLVTLDAGLGLPPDSTFTFAAGAYTIVDDLLRLDDTPTGMSIEVSGTSKTTVAPRVRFVPLVLGAGDDASTLKGHAETLAAKSRTTITDYYPLAPGGLTTSVDPLLDLKALARQHADDPLTAVLDRLRTMNAAPSTDRIIALVGPKDYALLGYDSTKSPATTYTGNVIVMLDPRGATDSTLRVGHEVAHTIPNAIWWDEQMVAECGRNYHNKEYRKNEGWAEGIRLDLDGREKTSARQIFTNYSQLMGGVKETKWITQCTYRNLLEGFASR